MSRSLRSFSRWQKLQAEQIKQVDNEIRVNINNCTATKIDSFEQREFLSLFGLIPNKQQNGKNKIRKTMSVRRPIQNIVNVRRVLRKRPLRDNDDSNNNHRVIRSKRKITIESITTDAYHDVCHAQDKLLARKQYLLNEIYEAIADKRKFDHFHEQDKQRNIILKIMINELNAKLMYLRN